MIFSTALVPALNHLLRDAEWARLRLHPFAGQTLSIGLTPLQFGFAITPEGLFASHAADADASVCIQLPAAAPLLALQDPALVLQQARISGNAEFAETLSFVFRNLSWDVEADLAPLLGDILAHRLVQTGKALKAHLSHSAGNLAANFSEYARDEVQVLVAPREMENFSSSLTTLRDDLARLEKRLQQLERQPR